MTAYFDTASRELSDAYAVCRDKYEGEYNTETIVAFERIEERIVFDCTVAAMLPGFPEQLRPHLHLAILKHAITMLPVTAPPADFETMEEHHRRLQDLQSDLHDVFHSVGHLGGSDSPLTGIRKLYAQGEEEREQMVESNPETAEHAKAWRKRLTDDMEGA